MARAATSGWKIGGTGWARSGSLDSPQANCGVLRAGSWTMVTRTLLRSCSSSQRNASWKPWMACLAPQYAVCSGIPR